jgi:hypothetical protein
MTMRAQEQTRGASRGVFVAFAGLSMAVLAGNAVAQPFFRPLFGLAGTGGAQATAISGDGNVIVGTSGGRATVWPIFDSDPFEIVGAGAIDGTNADGTVMTGTTIFNTGNPWQPPTAYRWSQTTGLQNLGAPNGESSGGRVSADGWSIAGGYRVGNDTQPARWSVADQGWRSLGSVPGYLVNGRSAAITPDGNAIVGWTNGNQQPRPFRWTAASGMQLIRNNNATDFRGEAADCSADAGVVVGGGDFGTPGFGTQAWVWSDAGGLTLLGDLPGGWTGSTATVVSDDGSVVLGWSGGASNTAEAFIWCADTGMLSLADYLAALGTPDLQRWTFVFPTGMSADRNTMCGWGTTPEGALAGWVVRIPSPGSLALTAVGVLALSLRRR